MKTESPAPDHEELKALLANSFHSEEAEDVPPLPDDLRERIRDQYGKVKAPAPPAPVEERTESFFGKLSRLFAQPAFSGAAAVLVLVAVAAVLLIPKRETTRGGDTLPPPPGVQILIIGFDADRAKSIASKFDPKAVKIVSEVAGQISDRGRTIVIDGRDNEIEGYVDGTSDPEIIPLPEKLDDIVEKTAGLIFKLKK